MGRKVGEVLMKVDGYLISHLKSFIGEEMKSNTDRQKSSILKGQRFRNKDKKVEAKQWPMSLNPVTFWESEARLGYVASSRQTRAT